GEGGGPGRVVRGGLHRADRVGGTPEHHRGGEQGDEQGHQDRHLDRRGTPPGVPPLAHGSSVTRSTGPDALWVTVWVIQGTMLIASPVTVAVTCWPSLVTSMVTPSSTPGRRFRNRCARSWPAPSGAPQ